MPLYQCLVFIILFAWLKMAEICKSPFDGDMNFDFDLADELDKNIWAASVALESIDNPNRA